MNATKLFDVDTRTEPRFVYIRSVRIVDEHKEDYDWIWEKLVELPSGCWEWTGKHGLRGCPVVENVPSNKRLERYVQRITWKLVKKETKIRGTIKQTCERLGCCNPAHFEII